MNCSFEWTAAAAHHPVRTTNVTLRPLKAAQLAVFDRSDVVSNRLSQRARTFEPMELAAFAALLRPQTVVLDIGSNIGWYTFNFATTHEVHAFEPNPSNLALQALSRCLNPTLARRITTYPVGLYDREPARCELHSSSRNLGNAHTLCGTNAEIAAKVKAHGPLVRRGSVEMRTLDTLVPEWLFHADKVVKLDVEGSEQVALMGATRLLTDGLPPRALFMEVTFFKGAKRRELYRFLYRYDYVPARLVRYNMLFVHAKTPLSNQTSPRHHATAAAECDDYCAFHRPPVCNATCGLRGLQNCCGWWEANWH